MDGIISLKPSISALPKAPNLYPFVQQGNRLQHLTQQPISAGVGSTRFAQHRLNVLSLDGDLANVAIPFVNEKGIVVR